jgi:predicted metal-binding protein
MLFRPPHTLESARVRGLIVSGEAYMKNPEDLERLFRSNGFEDYKWLSGKDVVTGEWVRMKCTFGCKSYAKRACCPPNVPSVDECRRFFDDYSRIAVFHF